MAHYVMSDNHGEADRFHAMLEKIQFSADDAMDLESRGEHLRSGYAEGFIDIDCGYATANVVGHNT